jgi:histidinol-phosphate aminotransferase
VTEWEQLLRPAVIEVGAYRPGVSGAEIKNRYGLQQVVRLNWNENLDGALPGVLEQAATELAASWAYPEESYGEFTEAVAHWTGVAPAQVLPGHGIQALTLALVSAFVAVGDRVVIPRPTYGLYAQACAVAGAEIERVDCGPSLALDLEAIAATARERSAKLVWICDPNNPTGLRLLEPEWRRFLDGLPAGCVAVVDEAYFDYIEPEDRIDRLADLREGRPIVIMRRAEAARARARLTEPLRAAGVRCLPSDANFVLIELGADDREIGDTLARDGLLVRPGSEFGLPGFVRVTIGPEDLMDAVAQRLLEALRAPARSAS